MALTKAEMSEYLFDKLGLSKRDAKELVELFSKRSVVLWKTENRSNSPGSATSICGIKTNARDVTRRRGGYSITARRVVTFRPGQKLKSRVENASPKDK